MIQFRMPSLHAEFPLLQGKDEFETVVRQCLEEKGTGHFFVAINPEKLIRAGRDGELQAILKESTANLADGIGVVMTTWLLQKKHIERTTGVWAMQRLLEILNEKKGTVFLFGGVEEVNEAAAGILKSRYPDLEIVGRQNGYGFDDQEVMEEIIRLRPDAVLVALGSPKQEKWIWYWGRQSSAKILLGVGGSFDVLVGRIRRAPVFFQKLGLEWSFRLLTQPSRWKRQVTLPLFVVAFLRDWFVHGGPKVSSR